MEFTVKVKGNKTASDPARTVRRAIEELLPELSGDLHVEEVFPGVRSGNLAGLVVVRTGPKISDADRDALLNGLRHREDVVYAETAAARKKKR